MFTQRRAVSSRFAAIALTLSAMVLLAETSRVSAGFVEINFDPGGTPTLSGPTFSENPSNVLESIPSVTPTSTSTGFTIDGLDYTVQSTGDVSWTTMREFTVSSPSAVSLGLEADVSLLLSKGGSSTITMTLTAGIYTQSMVEGQTTYTLVGNALTPSTGPQSLPSLGKAFTFAANQTLTSPILSANTNYDLILTSDLKIASLSGGTILVDPQYEASVSLPEPSSRLQFAILSTMMLAGLAGQRWFSRRRFDRAHFAATSPCG